MHPSPEFCILTSGFSPKMQNEPNLRTTNHQLWTKDYLLSAAFEKTNPISSPTPRQPQKNTKRTQSHPRPTTQIRETNPIKTTPDAIGPPLYLTPTEVGDTPTTQTRETNPICPIAAITTHQKLRNEPNSPPGPRPKYAKRTQFPCTQTKPNPSCINSLHKIGDSYLFQHYLRTPIVRNEPNLPSRHPATTQLCKTNPISTYQVSRPRLFAVLSLSKGPFMRNEPNSPPGPRPKYAKRTQSAPRPHGPTAKKCKTNPISVAPDLWRTKKHETNPKQNARHRRATAIFNPHGSGGSSHPPKKTQNEPNFPPTIQMRKTNPIKPNSNIAQTCPELILWQ